jgi:hypothetical protein
VKRDEIMTQASINHAGEAPMPMALNPCAEIEFTEASKDREAKWFWADRCPGEKVTPPKVPTSSCFADFIAFCEPTSVFRLRVERRFAAVWLLLLVAFPAVALDNEPTVFWKRNEEKGIYKRLGEATRLVENEDNAVIPSFIASRPLPKFILGSTSSILATALN